MKICVVGAGPAAAYFIKEFLPRTQSVLFDVFEKSSEVLGYLRKGVSPDQPGLRSTIPVLEEIFKSPRVKMITETEIGKDIEIKNIQDKYSAIVVAGGAEARCLNIPGREHAIPADRIARSISENRSIVANGSIGIIGNGNVSLDMARMLLHSKEMSHFTPSLKSVSVDKVEIIGRKSPEDAKFTNPVLSELLDHPSKLDTSNRTKDWIRDKQIAHKYTRSQRRRKEILENKEKQKTKTNKTVKFTFWESPVSITRKETGPPRKREVDEITDNNVRYQLKTVDDTGSIRTREYDAIISAIGYKPKDWKSILQGVTTPVYAIGWASSQGTGTLADAYASAIEAVDAITKEIPEKEPVGVGVE